MMLGAPPDHRGRTHGTCMRLTYDLIERSDGMEVEAVQVSDELNVDLAPDGTVHGIELLNANVQLGGEDEGALVVINEALGLRRELSLER
jgi:uncharacterized protein YuzE